MPKVTCSYCGKKCKKELGAINRAAKIGAPLYCNMVCSGLGRRLNKSDEQLKEEKRLYDIEYRRENLERIKANKKEYFQRTYDPSEAAVKRKTTMARHVEYCRKPEYRVKKKDYDCQYRAKKFYGEFWEAYLLILQVDKEVNSRMSDYEVRVHNGTLNKSLQRRKEYDRIISKRFEAGSLGDSQQYQGR